MGGQNVPDERFTPIMWVDLSHIFHCTIITDSDSTVYSLLSLLLWSLLASYPYNRWHCHPTQFYSEGARGQHVREKTFLSTGLASFPRRPEFQYVFHRFNVHGSVHCKIIPIYISNKMQRYTVYYISKLFYMFRVVTPPIIRSAYNCIYSNWYLSHRYCYLPLSWKRWNWFECAKAHSNQFQLFHDSGVTNTRYCRYRCMRSWWWMERLPETCRAVSRYNKLCNVAPCWINIGIFHRYYFNLVRLSQIIAVMGLKAT